MLPTDVNTHKTNNKIFPVNKMSRNFNSSWRLDVYLYCIKIEKGYRHNI